MPRVVSVFFPMLPVERIRRYGPGVPDDKALVLVARSGSKRWLSAVDTNALKLGLRVGMPASKAQAIVLNLEMIDADPRADAETVERLALWALRQYSPIVAIDGNDGIVMDTGGADHLHGGEELMLTGLVNALRHRKLTARAAIADTWGGAHALARISGKETIAVPRGETGKAVLTLPIRALRLPNEILQGLGTLGFETVGELAAAPRAPLTLRFGPEIGRRLDQIFGRMAEPIDPLRTAEMIEVNRVFAEPIGASETISKYVSKLSAQLTAKLEKRGLGVKRADLFCYRVDNTGQSLRVGFAKPVRDSVRLAKLLCDRIDRIDPGFGIEKLTLTAIIAEPLEEKQTLSSLVEDVIVDVTPVLDILGNRGSRLYRVVPVASDVPERSFARILPSAPDVGHTWATKWPRPPRLFKRPELIEVLALLPDHPPAIITWRGERKRVVRADGPERIFGEWWKREREHDAIRDYFVIEDEGGRRYWIYRSGDGVDTATGSHKWFVHGIFA